MRMMVRLFKGTLTVAAILGAVVAIFLIALNFYLNLPGTRQSVLTYASAALGLPIKAENLHTSVVKGIVLSNLKAGNPSSPREGVLLSAPTVTVTYAPLALLFQHRLLLHQAILQNPALALEEGADGRLLFPKPGSSPVPTDFFENLRLIIKSLEIQNGSILVVGPYGTPLLHLDGFQHGGRLERNQGTLRAAGQFSAQTLALKTLEAANLEGSYSYGDGFFKIPKILGTAYHGQWSGNLQAARIASNLPCDFSIQANGMDLNELLKAVTSEPDLLSGTLDFHLNGRSSYDPGRSAQSWQAQGSFSVVSGQLIRIDFIEALAATLGVKELSQPDFNSCQGDFSINDGQISVTSFDLKAANFELASTGPGSIGADGSLRLPVQLTLLPELSKLLTPVLAGQLSPAPGTGGQAVSFILVGSLAHSKVELPERLRNLTPAPPPPEPALAPIPAPVSPQ